MSTSKEINARPIVLAATQHGVVLNRPISAGAISIGISIPGAPAEGIVIRVGPIVVRVTLPSPAVSAISSPYGFVAWSKIGHLDFTIDRSNEAGYRPMDWRGRVHDILKLGNNWVVYGENGVSVMTPSGISHGMQTIHRLGTLCKSAVVGDDKAHYFIDKTSKLYRLSNEGLQMLDYSEFLSQMNSPRMSMDIELGLIYICDGEQGYVYSALSNSFGAGPANVTGVGSQDGILYVTAPSEIKVPKFEICTDVYDLGTRRPKTIQWIEVGTNLTHYLQVMIEARHSNKDNFVGSKWSLVNPSGICYIPCYGVEFKFRLRSYIYEYLELDWIKVTGTIHGFTYLDSLGYTYRSQ